MVGLETNDKHEPYNEDSHGDNVAKEAKVS